VKRLKIDPILGRPKLLDFPKRALGKLSWRTYQRYRREEAELEAARNGKEVLGEDELYDR
jgi:hypothetical protein